MQLFHELKITAREARNLIGNFDIDPPFIDLIFQLMDEADSLAGKGSTAADQKLNLAVLAFAAGAIHGKRSERQRRREQAQAEPEK